MEKRKRKHISGILLIVIDILLIGVVLNVFALFHHVIPHRGEAIRSTVTPAPSPQATIVPKETENTPEEPVETPVPTQYAEGDFTASFPTYDTGEGALYSYQSDNLRIAVNQVRTEEITYYIADVWVRNVKAFATAFAQGQYGTGIHQHPKRMAKDNGAILAVSGDYYGARSRGLVIRNGNLYRDSINSDVCILYADGRMETFEKEDFDTLTMIDNAWQGWSFGPQLLQDGQAIAEFSDTIQRENPRCAIGYYEPGHYCLVVVDGRQEGYSVGMTLAELSQLFASLNCKTAYNLDGGATAQMIFEGEVINRPYNGGRDSSDILCFGEGTAR